jgi:O-antigen/teichoic acid export membrane protein
VNGLLLGNIAISIFMLIIYAIENDRIKKSYKIGMDIIGARKEFGIIWRFSIPSLLSNVMVGPVMWLGNTFITAIPNGYTQLGVFNASNQWRTVLTFIPTAVGNVILPMIVNNKNNHRLERFNILFGWIIVICIAIPLIAAPELVGMLYGTGYKGDSFNISFILVILTCCILSYREGIARKLISNNLMWWGFLDNTIWGIIFLSVLYLVRNLGAVGISAAYSVAYIFNTLIFIPFYIKRGVVHRSLIISKEIILMWTSLLFQIATTAFIEYYLLRLLAAAFSLFSLYNLLKVMMAKQDLI